MFQIGDVVEVEKQFYWYDGLYEVGQRFVIKPQHIGHNFESWAKRV